ncbi:MAG: hypothetical protein ACK46L_11220, partial [Synechococcaceae cyanobacterium]
MKLRSKLLLAGLLSGLTLPAAAQEQLNGSAAICKTMSAPLVMTITSLIFAAIISVLILISLRLQRGGWSLANAVSEPTHLSIPLDEHWAQSQGDSQARTRSLAINGPPKPVILMEASTSRLIALAGSVAILLIYVGFGIFSLYTYGLTCQMPASTVAVSSFLYSGLTLFAPYVANKVSGRLPAGRAAPAQEPEPAAQAPLRQPAESPTKPRTVSALKPGTLERPAVKG